MEVRRGCKSLVSQWQARHLTLFAKTIVILSAELALNAFVWIIAVIVFTRHSNSQHKVLPLALIAWTTGLRHGLDADHISAIDNATRRIVSVPMTLPEGVSRIRRPVTVGLFFSLGHSTIVIATITAIAISAKVANGLNGFGTVGSIIGPAISGSFLILIGCINSYILYQTWTRLRRSKSDQASQQSKTHFNGIMTRLAMPLLRTVDRPWKLYPVGVLFGLGFDTASSIALLSVAVIAQQNVGQGGGPGNASVVLFAILFTAGMTLVDSIDSCLMIWAYAPDLTSTGKIRTGFWETGRDNEVEGVGSDRDSINIGQVNELDKDGTGMAVFAKAEEDNNVALDNEKDTDVANVTLSEYKQNASPDRLLNKLDKSASQLSLVLTLLSVIIAFVIGIIVLLGLIGDQCARCSRAADQQGFSGKGSLEGRWWLAWRRANDNFGYIGAGIVGLFAVSVSGYFLTRCLLSRRERHKENNDDSPSQP